MCRVCVVLRKVSQITIYINTSFLVKVSSLRRRLGRGRRRCRQAGPTGSNHVSPENTQAVTPRYYIMKIIVAPWKPNGRSAFKLPHKTRDDVLLQPGFVI